MIVHCPRCASRWRLAEDRLGPAGARVRCPRCEDSFVVARQGPGEPYRRPGEPVRPAGEPEREAPEPKTPERGPANPEVPAESPGRPTETPGPEGPFGRAGERSNGAMAYPRREHDAPRDLLALAHEALEGLEALAGAEVARSAAGGTLFREFGRLLLEAFDAWRRRVGDEGDATAFRAALRERWGVELGPADAAVRAAVPSKEFARAERSRNGDPRVPAVAEPLEL